jgi:hypothetical protein
VGARRSNLGRGWRPTGAHKARLLVRQRGRLAAVGCWTTGPADADLPAPLFECLDRRHHHVAVPSIDGSVILGLVLVQQTVEPDRLAEPLTRVLRSAVPQAVGASLDRHDERRANQVRRRCELPPPPATRPPSGRSERSARERTGCRHRFPVEHPVESESNCSESLAWQRMLEQRIPGDEAPRNDADGGWFAYATWLKKQVILRSFQCAIALRACRRARHERHQPYG